MANYSDTVEELPSGKWACFLRLQDHEKPIKLGKEFKDEGRAENWLNVSESVTAFEMMLRKDRNPACLPPAAPAQSSRRAG